MEYTQRDTMDESMINKIVRLNPYSNGIYSIRKYFCTYKNGKTKS